MLSVWVFNSGPTYLLGKAFRQQEVGDVARETGRFYAIGIEGVTLKPLTWRLAAI
jgi:hypothetical protein